MNRFYVFGEENVLFSTFLFAFHSFIHYSTKLKVTLFFIEIENAVTIL